MTFSRYTATKPSPYRLDELAVLTKQQFPAALAINEVDPNLLAVYLETPPTGPQLSAWQAAVLAHVPTATPTAGQNEATILTQAVNTALPRLDQIIAAAPAILARAQPTFTNISGAQTAARTTDGDVDMLVAAVRDMALYQRKIIRLITGKLDGTD